MAAPAFPSKAQLEAELAAEQAAAASAAAVTAGGDNAGNQRRGVMQSNGARVAEGDDSGPSELTLIAYSAFMGLSSLVFGGLTLLQARSSNSLGDESSPVPLKDMLLRGLSTTISRACGLFAAAPAALLSLDPQTMATSLLSVLLILSLAYLTNPSDSSFRSYLTDSSLHQHLRHIKEQQQLLSDSPTGTKSQSCCGAQSATRLQGEDNSLSSIWISEPAPPHVLTFSNRISISLRTPPYTRRDYGLLSLVTVSHAPESDTESSCGSRESSHGFAVQGSPIKQRGTSQVAPQRRHTSVFIGIFGRWWHAGQFLEKIRTRMPIKAKRSLSLKAAERDFGILSMQADEDIEGRVGGEPHDEQQSSSDREADEVEEPNRAVLGGGAGAKGARRRKAGLRSRTAPQNTGATPSARASPPIAHRTSDRANLHQSSGGNALAKEQTNPTQKSSITLLAGQSAEQDAVPQSVELTCQSGQVVHDATAITAAIADLQQQLASLKISTDSTQQHLQLQLEELRTRKKDEDSLRADLKGRMKALDEGKRLAEAAKRDAEKRLKSAQSVREALQKRSAAARAALTAAKQREEDSRQNVDRSLAAGLNRRQDIKREISEKQQGVNEAETSLTELQHKLKELETRVAEEHERVKAAEQSLAERMALRSQAALLPETHQSQHFQTQHAVRDGFHGLPTDAFSEHQFGEDLSGLSAHYPDELHQDFYEYPHAYAGPEGPWLSNVDDGSQQKFSTLDRRVSEDQYSSGFGSGGRIASNLALRSGIHFQPFASQDHLLGHKQFDGAQPSSPALEDNSALGSQSIARTPRHPRSFHEMSGAYQAEAQNAGVGPSSPFSTDLLPSNLFQSADDDSVAVSRDRSPRLKAALNRFGLDVSDSSDVEGQQSDRDTVDEILEGDLDPLSEHESDGEQQGSPQRLSARSGRSWWGSRARQPSKEERSGTSSKELGAMADTDRKTSGEAEQHFSQGKRRSFGVFPRLSLNPGARVFRSASRKQAENDALRGLHPHAFGSQGYLGPTNKDGDAAWQQTGAAAGSSSASVGHANAAHQTPFDAVLRAFEASNEPDEEEGRRSWSAFDQWSQRQGLPSRRGNLDGAAAGGTIGSSSPIVPSGLGKQSFSTWSDDLFQPLGRSSSAGASIETSNSSSLQDKVSGFSSRNSGLAIEAPGTSETSPRERPNRSRFAFWSQHSKGSVNSAGSASASDADVKDTSHSHTAPESVGGAGASPQAGGLSRGALTSLDLLHPPSSPGKDASSSFSAPSNASVLSSSNGDVMSSDTSGASARPASSKRRSFRWPRRQTSSAGKSTASIASISAASMSSGADVEDKDS